MPERRRWHLYELGHAVGYDSCARRDLEAAVFQHDRTNRNREIEIRPTSRVTDGAAVGSTRAKLEMVAATRLKQLFNKNTGLC